MVTESRDTEQFKSASLDRAAQKMWRGATGMGVPSGPSQRYSEFKDGLGALLRAATVAAAKENARNQGVK
jgi:hypothetical protein